MTNSRSMLASATLALTILVSGCGGSTDVSETAESVDSSDEATTTVAETTTTTEAPTTTTTEAPVAETDPNDPVVVAYCQVSQENQELANSTDFNDPEQMRVLVPSQIEALTNVVAPEAIADDIETVRLGFLRFEETLEEYDYVFADAGAALEETLGEEFEAATANLDDFESEFCPEIETGSAPDEELPDNNPLGLTADDVRSFLSTEAGRAGVAQGVASTTSLDEEQALCFVEMTDEDVLIALFLIGSATAEPDPDTLAGMEAGLDACGLSFADFAG